jgi:hypothetical protein
MKSFYRKNGLLLQNHGQGVDSDKISMYYIPKIPQICLICQCGPKHLFKTLVVHCLKSDYVAGMETIYGNEKITISLFQV